MFDSRPCFTFTEPRETKDFLERIKDREQKSAVLMHHRDTKFTKAFITLDGARVNQYPSIA